LRERAGERVYGVKQLTLAGYKKKNVPTLSLTLSLTLSRKRGRGDKKSPFLLAFSVNRRIFPACTQPPPAM
jgi:hypothetical protein